CSMTPWATSVFRRSASTFDAIPVCRWISRKRRWPSDSSRRISTVQRSPTTSSVRATEQTWFSNGRYGTELSVQPMLAIRNHTRYRRPALVLQAEEIRNMERRWKVLAVTATAAFMSFLDVTIVNIAFPSIARSFPESSLGDLSWVLNAYNVVFAALLIPVGRVADRVGRRRLFLLG